MARFGAKTGRFGYIFGVNTRSLWNRGGSIHGHGGTRAVVNTRLRCHPGGGQYTVRVMRDGSSIDCHGGACGAVVVDPAGVLHAQPHASVGSPAAQLAHGALYQRAFTAGFIQHRVEQYAARDAEKVLGVYIPLGEVSPPGHGALGGVGAHRRGGGHQARGALHRANQLGISAGGHVEGIGVHPLIRHADF